MQGSILPLFFEISVNKQQLLLLAQPLALSKALDRVIFLVLENPGLRLPVVLQVLAHPGGPVRGEVAQLADESVRVSILRRTLVALCFLTNKAAH